MNSTTTPLLCKVPKFEISKDAKIDIPAYGGRMDVRWDPGTKVTASGGLAYFALFLKTTGLFESLCSDFPVDYRSNNSCSKRDIAAKPSSLRHPPVERRRGANAQSAP